MNSSDDAIWQGFVIALQQSLGIDLTEQEQALFQALYQLLITANQQTNLTRITALEDFVTLHLLDSLSLVPHLPNRETPFSLVDVGSGAGFPALPLAILFPKASIVAVESVQKKARFMIATVEALGLNNLKVLSERAEDVGRMPAYRTQFDYATARAVAALPVLCELCLPLLKIGGRFLAYKTQEQAKQDSLENALTQLGGKHVHTHVVQLPGLENRVIVEIHQNQVPPQAYPRKAGLLQKKPL